MGKISKNELNTSLATKIEEIDLKANISDLETTNSQLAQDALNLETHEGLTKTDNPHGLKFRGVLLRKSNAQSIPNNIATPITYQSAIYQEGATFWDISDSSKIVIPAGVSKVRLSACVIFSAFTTGSVVLNFRINGVVPTGFSQIRHPAVPGASVNISFSSAIVNVVEGDVLQVFALQNSGAAIDILGVQPDFFGLEVVQ